MVLRSIEKLLISRSYVEFGIVGNIFDCDRYDRNM